MTQSTGLSATAALLIGLTFAVSAQAQNDPTGGNPTGISNPAPVQPRQPAPDIAPPALPGASAQVLSTAPKLTPASSGDPTTALFTAINKADYAAAQDAVSRGADLNAQNSLGESPLDLAISLNRNDITFMLLSARNESGDSYAPPATPATARNHAAPVVKTYTVPARLVETPKKPAAPANVAGTPNVSVGFLGFGTK